MKIGIVGVNKISKFYAIVLAQYGHEVILYESPSVLNNLTIDKIILQEDFFNNTIKPLPIFNYINYKTININIIEKYFFKESSINEKFVEVLEYQYVEDFKFEKIPNIEIVSLNSKSINQIKMMEDILIIDSPANDIIEQIDIMRLKNWTSFVIQSEKNHESFQITKQKSYSIFGINEKERFSVFINCKNESKKEVLKILKKKLGEYKIINQQAIVKYDKYAYKNVAIINTALLEHNYPYRDYSLLVQIINKTEPKKIFVNLDIYSDIKGQVI